MSFGYVIKAVSCSRQSIVSVQLPFLQTTDDRTLLLLVSFS